MGFIVDSTDEYIMNTNHIKKVYCLEDYNQFDKTSRWILWADCVDGRFQLDVKDTRQEIRDSFWKYYKWLKEDK